MKKNIGKNAILNVIRQCLSIVFPLITYPYILRVLSVEGIGVISYSQSLISYFALFAMLGINNYAIREGAKIREDKAKLERFCSQVFSINLISTLLAYIGIAVCLCISSKLAPFRTAICILSLQIIFTTLGADWINGIFEDYFIITIRSIFSHLVSLVLLFLLVKSSSDILLYAFITILGNLITCLLNWFYIRKYVQLRVTTHINIQRHLKPLLLIFSNSLAISIYVNLDTTMLGWIKGTREVGLYSAAVKIYTVIKGVLAAIYQVSIPRLSMAAESNLDEFKKIFTSLCAYLSLLLTPIGVGLFVLSPYILKIMGGVEYLPATNTLRILAVSLIIAILGGLVTACLNISIKRERINLEATALSATMNFLLNLVFIPHWGIEGAAFTTLLSEVVVLVYCCIKTKNIYQYIELGTLREEILHSIIGSAGIAVYLIFVLESMSSEILGVCLGTAGSIILYFFLLKIFNDRYINSVNLNSLKEGR